MVHHFFQGKFSQLAPHIINSFMERFEDIDQMFYVCFEGEMTIFGDLESEKAKYDAVFSLKKSANFVYVYSQRELVDCIVNATKVNQKIIMHGHFSMCNSIYAINKLIFNKYILSKIVFIHWGVPSKIKYKLRSKVLQCISSYFYRHIRMNIVLVDGDKAKLQALYFYLKNINTLGYFSTASSMSSLLKLCIDRQPKQKVKIIVSHSGHIYNHHLESFRVLKDRFDDVIEQVSCPLCYGPSDYIDQVIKVGIELFGNRFHYFTDLIPRNEYADYFRASDIFISAINDQGGLGAATIAYGNGLKVYVGKIIYEHLHLNNIKVFSFSELEKNSTNSFISPLANEEIVHNYDYLMNDNRVASVLESWRQLMCN